MNRGKIMIFSMILIGVFSNSLHASDHSAFNNTWELIKPMSLNIDLELKISVGAQSITIIHNWQGLIDSIHVTTDGKRNRVPVLITSTPTTLYSAMHMVPGSDRIITATWEDGGNMLVMKQKYPVEISQGTAILNETHTFKISKNNTFLTYTINRDSRPDQPTAKYVFKIKGSLRAYGMELEDNWEVRGDLQRQALLISLQGLVNRNAANLYFVYPETWQFNYSRQLYEWYEEDRGYTFDMLNSPNEALTVFRDYIKGYVVWDKNVRTSLIVAYTVAGLEDAVVVSEDQIEMLDSLGFTRIEDFRGKFTGKNDAEIYKWAKDKYWERCSRKFIIWLGGSSGKILHPGVADWGVANRVFFQDLSTNPVDTTEYNLAKELLGDMNANALVMGWHSYAKDLERQHITLCSSFGLPVLGLHSNPNISFENKIGFSEGFEFKNNHNIDSTKIYKPEKKVYVACIQTDGIGIGAWLKPGRGEIPYAWETLMNYNWLAPSLLEFFYSTATPNDYFIGAISGPGYMYPKSVPKAKLPGLIRRADSLMQRLDLRVFDIMDYSVNGRVSEFADLTLSVIEAYFENMPTAIGFVNGYIPANTYYNKDSRPMISFEYYLSPEVSKQEAVADIIELANLNKIRPYFLLMHIRESSNISHVKSILEQLPDDFEVIPLDIFIKMAGENPTFIKRYIDR